MNEEFGNIASENQVEGIEDDWDGFTVSSGWGILASIITMSFWSFGTLPLSLDLIIFLPLRLVFWFIILRNIRGTGA